MQLRVSVGLLVAPVSLFRVLLGSGALDSSPELPTTCCTLPRTQLCIRFCCPKANLPDKALSEACITPQMCLACARARVASTAALYLFLHLFSLHAITIQARVIKNYPSNTYAPTAWDALAGNQCVLCLGGDFCCHVSAVIIFYTHATEPCAAELE
jgi:hypothetical protein